MDDGSRTEQPDAPEASEPPLILVLAFGVPVVAVVAWFLVRLSTGRWITDPEHDHGLHGGDDPDDDEPDEEPPA